MSKNRGGVLQQSSAELLLISHLLKEASDKLKKTSDSPALDAELLLAHCLKKNRTYLYTWPEASVSQSQFDCFNKLVEKRLTDYPVAYMLGKKAFWTLDLIVTPDVLIPRPETELLVETALDKMKNISNPTILDLGTGSGAIALAIASERPDAKIIATDYSQRALDVAIKNAENNDLNKQVTFIKSHWFENIEVAEFNLIVSNPPYIDPSDPYLLGTIKHEPQQALIADKAGISDIEIIIEKSTPFLKKGSWLILEHGFNQGGQTKNLLIKKDLNNLKTLNDLNGKSRITIAMQQ